jgi:hypothetical protein
MSHTEGCCGIPVKHSIAQHKEKAQHPNQPTKQTTDSDSKKEEIRFMEVLPVMLLYVIDDIINIT